MVLASPISWDSTATQAPLSQPECCWGKTHNNILESLYKGSSWPTSPGLNSSLQTQIIHDTLIPVSFMPPSQDHVGNTAKLGVDLAPWITSAMVFVCRWFLEVENPLGSLPQVGGLVGYGHAPMAPLLLFQCKAGDLSLMAPIFLIITISQQGLWM